jgi:tetratricopeptide (TPR) repeat protein
MPAQEFRAASLPAGHRCDRRANKFRCDRRASEIHNYRRAGLYPKRRFAGAPTGGRRASLFLLPKCSLQIRSRGLSEWPTGEVNMNLAKSYALPLILLTICSTNATAQPEHPARARPSTLESVVQPARSTLRAPTAEEINNEGSIYADAQQYEKAIEQFKLAISLNPRLFEAHTNLGHVHAWNGQFDEAIAALKEAAQIDPSNAKAHFNLGRVYYRAGQAAEAIRSLEQAIALKPAYDEAEMALRRAVELQPDLAQAQYNLGALYATLKNKRAALAVQATLRHIDPELGRKLFNEIHQDKILAVSRK